MKLLRLLLASGGLGALALSASGCLTAPSYSTTPEISFNRIYTAPFNNATGQGDTVAVTINYQDGDGDLGLTEAEAKANAGTMFANNYFVEPYIKVPSTGQFKPVAGNLPIFVGSTTLIQPGAYNSRYPHVSATTDNRALPLKGTLTWGYSFYRYSPFSPGDEIRFQITIADRAQHISNTITTESVVLSK